MAVGCIAAAPGYAKIVPAMQHLATIHNHGPTSSRQWAIPDVRGKIRRPCVSPTWAHTVASGQGCGIRAIGLNRPWRMPKPDHSRCFERRVRRVYVDHN